MNKKLSRTRDMTEGPILSHLLVFALPVLLGNILQQFYNLVDTVVIGRIEGVTAQAAVSSSGWLNWAVISLAIGLAEGFSIAIAQHFGAGNDEKLRRDAGQSILLSVSSALLLTVLSEVLLRRILFWMQTPEEVFELTCLYLRIIFGGIPLVLGFNLASGFLRSMGDSRTPLIAMVVSTFLNIGLDILFVGSLKLSVTGVAAATTISQGVSLIICLVPLVRMPVMAMKKSDLRPCARDMRRLMRLALPISLQYGVISVGGLVLQGVVNSYGFLFMAGYSAAAKLQGLIEMAGSSVSSAVGTFTGQNWGAGRVDRVKKGVRSSVLLCTLLAVVIGGITLLTGRGLMSLFVRDDPDVVVQVLDVASRFLVYMCAGLWGLYMLFCYRSSLQGMGKTMTAMISGLAELVMRVGAALILPAVIGEEGVFLAEILAWYGAALWLVIGYYCTMSKISRNMRI